MRLVSVFDNLSNEGTISADDMLKRSPDIASMVDYWDLTDALIEGEDAVKLAGEQFLPKFPNEAKDKYKLRLSVAKYTNIYGDIVENLASKPFEEEISFATSETKTVPDDVLAIAENIDGAGNNQTVFASHVFYNGINSAVDWIFVDYPKADPSRVITLADAKRENIRPFWSHVLGRNIIEAKATVVGGKERLTYIKILEPGDPDHVRIFMRDGDLVTYELWQKFADKSTGTSRFKKVEDGTISIPEIPLVPFATGRRNGRTFKYDPPMRAAAHLQRTHYRQESALEFIKMMCAYPMLAGNGINPPKDATGKPIPLDIGPGVVLYSSPNADGSVGAWAYVEPSAQSLTFLASDIEKTEKQLRELGRNPLTAQSGNITVITAGVAASKARSAVGAWALLLKDALENAWRLTMMYMNNREYEPEVNVYNEFDQFTDGGSDLEQLRAMRASGDLSQETYWYEVRRRRVLSPEFDPEKERERLLEEIPSDDGEDDSDDLDNPIEGQQNAA